jgi:uncharacterized YigZ family protein
MKLINEEYINTIIISKSEFITRLFRVNNIDEVNKYLAETRKKHYDASHNCYAYILGDNAEIEKCSDDGEPIKTAGAPMLDALKKNNVTNILAITTRYFGGILLGAGGLVRAYSKSVSEALKLAKFYVVKEQTKFTMNTSYSGYNTLIKSINYIKILNTFFNTDVLIEAACDKELFNNLKDDLYKYKIDAITLNATGNINVEIPIEDEN